MIITEIKGGFGNQLFSYACAYSLAKKHQDNLILDKNIYDLGYFRPFELDKLQIDSDTVLIKSHVSFDRYAHPFRTKLYQLKRACKIGLFTKKVVETKEFEYHPELLTYKTNVHLSGYWQNYKYFHAYCKDIQRQFMPKKNFSKEISHLMASLKNENSVCMHIRRGDYATFKGGKCLSMDYYKEALTRIENTFHENCKIYVFSDDISFVKEMFADKPNFCYLSDSYTLTDLEEFFLMSACKNHIIANSTYSWWAAYLNTNEEKIVIAPEVDLWKREYYPENWNVINAYLS